MRKKKRMRMKRERDRVRLRMRGCDREREQLISNVRKIERKRESKAWAKKEKENKMKEHSLQTLQDTVFFFSGGEEFERNPGAEKAEIS